MASVGIRHYYTWLAWMAERISLVRRAMYSWSVRLRQDLPKVSLGFILILMLVSGDSKQPRFHKGQVVAVTVTETATQQYLKIGFIAKRISVDGKVFYQYTDNETDFPPYWNEDVLRKLTRRECGNWRE